MHLKKIDFFNTVNQTVDDIIKNTVFDITNNAQTNSERAQQKQAMSNIIHLYVNVGESNQKNRSIETKQI